MPIVNLLRGHPAEDRRPAVALLFRRCSQKVAVALGPGHVLDIARMGLDFLQADDVGFARRQVIEQPFFRAARMPFTFQETSFIRRPNLPGERRRSDFFFGAPSWPQCQVARIIPCRNALHDIVAARRSGTGGATEGKYRVSPAAGKRSGPRRTKQPELRGRESGRAKR